MTENNDIHPRYQEGIFTAISIGFCLLLVGALFIITPDLISNVVDFFKDFGIVDVPNTDIIFMAPESPANHSVVYQAAGQFSIALAIFQVIILALRFVIPSSLNKKSESVSSLVYWIGASVLTQAFLIDNAFVTLTNWFEFWSLIIVMGGVSILTRTAFMAIVRIQQ